MKASIRVVPLLGFLLGVVPGAPTHAQQPPARDIEQVGDNLFRATNYDHRTVFLVTDAGIVLSDPINPEFAAWLKAELDERFAVPVKNVVYSHHHWDHVSGGDVFESTAVFVGHENMLNHLALPPEGTRLPADALDMDANGDRRISRSEARDGYASRFSFFDANGDGFISGPEAMRGPLARVRPPDVTYSDRIAISLGGKSVELIYTGDMTHSDDMSIIRFPDERAIFVVDWIHLDRLPYRTLGDGKLDAWLNAIRFAEALDYEIVVGGHGNVGGKAGIIAFRGYLESLRKQVAAGIAAGSSLADLQASIKMDRYRDWINYEEWRALNIEGMYNILSME